MKKMKSMSLLLVSRVGAGIAGATIPTAQAYIADTTTLEKRPKGMALIGMAVGLVEPQVLCYRMSRQKERRRLVEVDLSSSLVASLKPVRLTQQEIDAR